MARFSKPIIYASECLGFTRCRYDGVMIYDDFIEELKPYVNYITACPEVEIGLGIPRKPIRIVLDKGVRRLKQPATRRDVTAVMKKCITSILGVLPDVDGFILKSRSPSCGIKDTKYYSAMNAKVALGKGAGLFGAAISTRFPKYPIEDEKSLHNWRTREHFLTRIFTLARFRTLKQTRGALVRFHTEHKLLLMAYRQKFLKILGKIVANGDGLPIAKAFAAYREHLFNALLQPPRPTSYINVIMHQFGYFRKHLTPGEKKDFLNRLERYQKAQIPLRVIMEVINMWTARFEEHYLTQQTFFQPYPEALVKQPYSNKKNAFRL